MVREERRDEQKMKRGFREGEKMKPGLFSDLRRKFFGIRADLKLNVISGGCEYRCDGSWHFRISAVTIIIPPVCHDSHRCGCTRAHTHTQEERLWVCDVNCGRTGRVGPGARHRAG